MVGHRSFANVLLLQMAVFLSCDSGDDECWAGLHLQHLLRDREAPLWDQSDAAGWLGDSVQFRRLSGAPCRLRV